MVYWALVSVFSVAIYYWSYAFRHHHPLTTVTLPGSAYGLVIFSAVRQAKMGERHQRDFNPVAALCFAAVVSALQILLVYLLVAGINPYSQALASEPAQEWMTE